MFERRKINNPWEGKMEPLQALCVKVVLTMTVVGRDTARR